MFGRAGLLIRLTLAMLAPLLLLRPGGPTPLAVASAPATAPAGWPAFLIGANYQGPADRAWRGDYWAWWADDLFDPAVVNEDFKRASAAGLNSIRLFVQRELLQDLRENDYAKLDAVLDLADRNKLRLIITLGDYDEPRVATLARQAGAIAQRYAGRPTILAYDLRNEPTFWTLQTAMYPGGQKPPLLSRLLLDTYGEQAAQHFIDAFRASEEGQRGPLAIPERFSDEETYVYHNNWIMSYKLSLEATAWAKAKNRTDLEYFGSAEAAGWRTLLDALDQTYAAWLDPQIQAIKQADPGAVVTVGHHDALMAALPSNQRLDVLTPHRYDGTGPGALAEQRKQLLALRAMYPDKPIVLGEFGHRATEIGDEAAAIEESATLFQLLADGFGGGLKWMLNDTRDGTDTMGLFRMDGSPRPIAYSTALISRLALAGDGIPAGELKIAKDDGGATCYRYTRDALVAVGGRCGASGAPIDLMDAARQLFASKVRDGSYVVGVTAPTRLALKGLAGGGPAGWTLVADGAGPGTLLPSLLRVALVDVEAGRTYRLIPSGTPGR